MNQDEEKCVKKPHPLVKDVKKMLKEYNLESASPQVVANLTCIAENMAIDLLKTAAFYSNKKEDGEPVTIEKNDIDLAINLRYQDDVKLPNEDALIDAAVAVNGNSLVVRDSSGVSLPKDHIGNCNYQLENPNKKLKMDAGRLQSRPYYAYIMPYKNYKTSTSGNMSNYMLKNPMQMHNMNELPMKITITPKYGMMPPMYGQSMLKKNFDKHYE